MSLKAHSGYRAIGGVNGDGEDEPKGGRGWRQVVVGLGDAGKLPSGTCVQGGAPFHGGDGGAERAGGTPCPGSLEQGWDQSSVLDL